MRWLVVMSLAVVAACSPVEERKGVSYDDRFSATKMDLYLPEDGQTGRPAVVFVHGGGWRGGDRAYHHEDALRLARSGWVTATLSYRLAPEHRFPAAYQDVHCSLSFLRANADELGIDPDRIALAGMSAGAHLVSLVGVAANDPSIATDCEWGPTGPPAAVISAAGPQDLRPVDWAEAVQDFMGGTADEMPERYDAASPIHHAGPDAPPFLFLHGELDVFVDVDDSRRMQDELRAHGNDARLMTFPGGGHLLNPGTGGGDLHVDIPLTTPEAWPVIADFLTETMGAPDA